MLLQTSAKSQQDAMYSQYMFNMLAVNPAYAGNREVLSITGLTRAQWLGIDGAPVSGTLSLDMPISKKNIGLGAQLFTDKIGVTSSSGFYLSYAYRIHLRKSTLAFGLQGGLIHYTANYVQLQLNRNMVSGLDQSFQENVSVLMPGAGAGFFLSDDKYYVGASIPNLLNSYITSSSQLKVNRYDHLFMMCGYVFSLGENYNLKPSTLLKCVKGAPVEWDINLNLWIHNKVALGISYRTHDAAVAMIELQASDKFRIGYAYDYTVTALQHFHSGSHELLLRFEFGYSNEKILTPRYF